MIKALRVLTEKSIVVITIIAFIILVVLFNTYHNADKFKIKDIYTDSTNNKKIVFCFVHTKENKLSALKEFGSRIYKENANRTFYSDSGFMFVAVYFYNSIEEVVLNSRLKEQISKKYLSLRLETDKLNYIKNGYIYTKTNKIAKGIDFPIDTIFKSDMVVPRDGYSIKELLLNKKTNKKSH